MVTETKAKEPWGMTALQYQMSIGVHQPWIAEISPWQMGQMSKRQKAAYEKKRSAEWQASADAKAEWREKVLEAYDKGVIDDDTSMTDEARDAISYGKRKRSEETERQAFDKAYAENRIESVNELKVGDRVYDLMTRKYGEVKKLYKKSVQVKWDEPISVMGRETDTYSVNVRQLQWKSYDDLKEQVEKQKATPPPKPAGKGGKLGFREWQWKYGKNISEKEDEAAWRRYHFFGKRREPTKPSQEKPPRLTVRPKTYRGEAGYTVKGEGTDIFFEQENQAREYVSRIKGGDRPDDILSDIWKIKKVRSGYSIAELQRIHASRSPLSQATDERQSHQVTIDVDSPKARAWITNPGRADITGIDTPRLTKKSPRITPKRPRLKR